MGAKIPPEVSRFGLTIALEKHGCKLFAEPGKVSEVRIIPDHPDLLMIVTLPRKSTYDFVHNGIFGKTDEIITAMTVLIQGVVLKNLGIPTDLVAFGKDIDKYLPPKLQNNIKLQKCAIIVTKYDKESTEFIWRFNHTGSAVKSLKSTGKVYGHTVRPDIKEGEEYDEPLDTPTTKAEEGHDMPIDRTDAEKLIRHTEYTRAIAVAIRNFFKERGIDVADLKLECSKITADVIYMLDKFGPDEARFWDSLERLEAVKNDRVPKSMDKEIVRAWSKGIPTPFKDDKQSQIVGLNNLDPENAEHVKFVHKQKVPQEVIDATVAAYFEIFRRAYDGKDLKDFQRDVMGIAV